MWRQVEAVLDDPRRVTAEHEGTDDLPPAMPVEAVETSPDPACKLLQTSDHQLQAALGLACAATAASRSVCSRARRCFSPASRGLNSSASITSSA